MYGKDGRSGNVRRANAERKALQKKAERAAKGGKKLTSKDYARFNRVDGVVEKLLYQESAEFQD